MDPETIKRALDRRNQLRKRGLVQLQVRLVDNANANVKANTNTNINGDDAGQYGPGEPDQDADDSSSTSIPSVIDKDPPLPSAHGPVRYQDL
ncbi:hypothetical protein Ct61P_15134 [Colletotrichum tofieldiae]|nr:hypothetical protein Ct61P_15134 [Colletotrichum tofieldiae]